MEKKPKQFLILKIVGFVGLALLIFGIYMAITGFGDFENEGKFMVGIMLTPFALIMTFVGLIMGFKPEIAKMKAKSAKYIQQENKQDLSDIALNIAEINKQAVQETAKAIKTGVEDTKFCRFCGAQIKADSAFCDKCGKEQ